MTTAWIIVTALATACSPAPRAWPGGAQEPPAPQTPTATPAATPAATDGSVDQVLGAAEAAGAQLGSMACTVSIEKRDALTDEVERRRGRLVVSGTPGPARRIALRIDQFIDASGRASEEPRRFLYRDGWLIERDDARKQVIERQLVPEGTMMDPLQPGEGPLALPVGATRAEVLRSYDAVAATLPESALWKDQPVVDALLLTPKSGTAAARSVKSLIVAWDRSTHLPIAVVSESIDGDRTLARLRGVTTATLSAADATLVEPAPVPEGWSVDRRPLKP